MQVLNPVQEPDFGSEIDEDEKWNDSTYPIKKDEGVLLNIRYVQDDHVKVQCICSSKGKILLDLYCYATDNGFLLEIRKDLVSTAMALLQNYLLAFVFYFIC